MTEDSSLETIMGDAALLLATLILIVQMRLGVPATAGALQDSPASYAFARSVQREVGGLAHGAKPPRGAPPSQQKPSAGTAASGRRSLRERLLRKAHDWLVGDGAAARSHLRRASHRQVRELLADGDLCGRCARPLRASSGIRVGQGILRQGEFAGEEAIVVFVPCPCGYWTAAVWEVNP